MVRALFFSKPVVGESSLPQLALIQLLLGLQSFGAGRSLAPHPAVKALICLATIVLMQLGLTLLTSATFLFFFFSLKDRRLPCDPSLFLSNDTQPWFG